MVSIPARNGPTDFELDDSNERGAGNVKDGMMVITSSPARNVDAAIAREVGRWSVLLPKNGIEDEDDDDDEAAATPPLVVISFEVHREKREAWRNIL